MDSQRTPDGESSSPAISGPTAGWKMLHDEYIALGGTQEQLDDAVARVLDARTRAIDAHVVGAVLSADAEAPPVADSTLPTEESARVEAYCLLMHERMRKSSGAEPRVALCFSGGGIRSATFNLGVLQGLTENKVLEKVDYLSTVSGGGYVGSWFTSWRHRARGGLAEVARQLTTSTDGDQLKQGKSKDADDEAAASRATFGEWRPDGFRHEAPPIQHLRRFTRYLSPRVGLLSMDTWTIAVTYLRNLTLNWLVLIPILAAMWLIPRMLIVATDWVWASSDRAPIYAGMAGLLAAAMAFMYPGLWAPGATADRPQKARSVGVGKFLLWTYIPGGRTHFMMRCWLPLVLASVMLPVYMAGRSETPAPAVGAVDGAVVWFAGQNYWMFGLLLGIASFAALLFRRREKSMLQQALPILAGGFAAGVGLVLCSKVLALMGVEPSVVLGPDSVARRKAAMMVTAFGPPLILLALSFGGTMYVGLISRSIRSRDADREWWARLGAWLLSLAFFWAAVSSLVLFAPLIVIDASTWWQKAVAIGTSAGGLIAGLVTVVLGRGEGTPANGVPAGEKSASDKVRGLVLSVAPPAFILFFIAAISLSTSGVLFLLHKHELVLSRWWASTSATASMNYHLRTILEPELPALLLAFGALLGFGLAMSWAIQLNRFSMHALYRTRLIRAYMGASRFSRTPNPFTLFDDRDNLQMHDLRPEMLRSSDLLQERKFYDRVRSAATCPNNCHAVVADLAIRVKSYDRLLLDDLQELIERDGVGSWEQDVSVRGEVSVLNSRLCRAINQALLFCHWDGEGVKPSGSVTVLAREEVIANRRVFDTHFRDLLRFPDRASDSQLAREIRPFHVVNVALNLVGDSDAAVQDRKAASFTMSPLHCGSFDLGYRDSRDYGGHNGMTLGTAMAISGAAVSPNMGYHSSAMVALLLALFNVRLGSWMGNPGKPGERGAYRQPSPFLSVWPLLFEAFGLTDATRPHVYLSDGGHFENLGMYEMVRRRCHVIIVSDASADSKGTFEDLGRAFERIGIDLGVPISLVSRGGPQRIKPRAWCAGEKADPDGRYCAIGRIHYSRRDPGGVDGILVYVKAALYGSEPISVTTYAGSHPTFPHEPTGDQFFTESQFESYRLLGHHIIDSIMKCEPPPAPQGGPVQRLIEKACTHRGVEFDTEKFEFKRHAEPVKPQLWSEVHGFMPDVLSEVKVNTRVDAPPVA